MRYRGNQIANSVYVVDASGNPLINSRIAIDDRHIAVKLSDSKQHLKDLLGKKRGDCINWFGGNKSYVSHR